MSEDYKKPFVPIWMDQAGFTPHQYRILGHFWSRGEGRCFPSMETIATCCKVNLKTVKRTIKELEILGFVQRKKRKAPGVRFSNEYILTGPKGAPVKNEPAQKEPLLTGPKETPANRPKRDPGNDTSGNDTSLNETSLFQGEISPMAESVPPKKNHLQELAEEIYQAYPKKTAKPDALKAIIKAMKENDQALLLERTKAYAGAIGWKEKQFIPYPATWFNKGHFNDDPSEWNQPSKPTPTPAPNTAHRRRGYQENLELP